MGVQLADYHVFVRLLEADLAAQGVPIAASFCLPAPARRGLRLPQAGARLLLRARDVLGAELAGSFVIGNALRDVEAGLAAGCAGAVWIASERPAELPAGAHWAADFSAARNASARVASDA